MTVMISYDPQDNSEADIQAVVEVLRSSFLTQVPAVPAFESAVADYCGAAHALAVDPCYFHTKGVETLLSDASKARILGCTPKISFDELVNKHGVAVFNYHE